MTSAAQAREALRGANEVRRLAAEARKEIREGRLGLAEALLDARTAPVKIERLVSYQHGYGLVRARKLLYRAGIRATETRVDELSSVQVAALLPLLREADERARADR